MSTATDPREAFDARALVSTSFVVEWARTGPARRSAVVRSARDRIVRIRAFADGSRAQLVVSRAIERGRETSWKTIEETIDTATGVVVAERPPWRPTDEQIARAVASLAPPASTASLRATSSDGRCMFFIVGRNPSEQWDPDAGTLVSYDVTLGLWDEADGAWRWETSASPAGLGVGTWLLEQAAFDFTLDDSLIVGHSSSATADQAYVVADGSLRWHRGGITPPRPAGLPDGTMLAGDRAGAYAVVVRGTQVELWDIPGGRVIASLDLQPIDDVATSATVVSPAGDLVVGTERGRLLRVRIR